MFLELDVSGYTITQDGPHRQNNRRHNPHSVWQSARGKQMREEREEALKERMKHTEVQFQKC